MVATLNRRFPSLSRILPSSHHISQLHILQSLVLSQLQHGLVVLNVNMLNFLRGSPNYFYLSQLCHRKLILFIYMYSMNLLIIGSVTFLLLVRFGWSVGLFLIRPIGAPGIKLFQRVDAWAAMGCLYGQLCQRRWLLPLQLRRRQGLWQVWVVGCLGWVGGHIPTQKFNLEQVFKGKNWGDRRWPRLSFLWHSGM